MHLSSTPPEHLLGEMFWIFSAGKRDRAGPGNTGKITSVSWLGNTLMPPLGRWGVGGRGDLGFGLLPMDGCLDSYMAGINPLNTELTQ